MNVISSILLAVCQVNLVTYQSPDLDAWESIRTNSLVVESNAYYKLGLDVDVFDPREEAIDGVDAFIAQPQPQPPCISVWNSRGDPNLDTENPGKYRNVILVEPDVFVMTEHYRLEVGDFVLWQDGEDTFMRQVVETKFHSWLDIGLGWLDKPVPVEPVEVFRPFFINTSGPSGYVWQLYPVIGFDCDGDWCVHELAYYKPTITLWYPNKVYDYGDSHWDGESGRPVFAHVRGRPYLLGLFTNANKTLVAVTDEIMEQIKGEREDG